MTTEKKGIECKLRVTNNNFLVVELLLETRLKVALKTSIFF